MRVVRNYLYNVAYQMFILIIPLITVPYISRIVGPTGVGINAYTNSIIQYFILFGSIGISLYGNREIAYVRDDKGKLSRTFWEIEILRVSTISIAYILFLGFLLVTNTYHDYFIFQSLLIISAALDISWFYMGLEDFKKTVTRNMIVKILTVILIFTFVKSKTDLGLYILILSLSQLFGNLTLWPYLRKTLVKINWNKLNILRHLRPSIGLFIPQIAIQIYLVLNKTMLGQMDGVSSVGYFDNSDKIIKMVLAIVTATGTVMLPHVANSFAKGKYTEVSQLLANSFDFVSFLAIPLMFGVSAISLKLAPWFFGSDFKEVGPVMMIESIVILLIAWSNVTGQQFLMPTNKIKYYTISVTIGAIINLLLNVPLISLYGVIGVAISTVISELVVTSYQLYKVKLYISLKLMFTNVYKYLIAGIIMFIVVFYVDCKISFGLVSLIGQILLGILVYIGILIFLKPTIFKKIRDFKE